MKRRVVVAGGSGSLGKSLSEICPNWIYIGSKDCDLRDEFEALAMVRDLKPEVVVHLAAKVGGILANKENQIAFFEDNLAINLNLIKACRTASVPKLLAVNSTCAFPDRLGKYPFSEEALHNGPPYIGHYGYGFSKRMLQVHCQLCRDHLGLDYSNFFACNLYGEHDDFRNEKNAHFITALISKVKSAIETGTNRIELIGTGTAYRQFMYAGDLARAIKLGVEEHLEEDFIVAPPGEMTIREIANTVISVFSEGRRFVLAFNDDKDADGQHRKTASSNRFLKRFPKFRFTPLNEGLTLVRDRLKEQGF